MLRESTYRVVPGVDLHSSFGSTEWHVYTRTREQRVSVSGSAQNQFQFKGEDASLLTDDGAFVRHQRGQRFHLIHGHVCAITDT